MAGKWTDEEADFLREAASSLTLSEIASSLGRSVSAVRQKAMSLGLATVDGRSTSQARDRMREMRAANPISNQDAVWSVAEDTVLQEYAPTSTLRVLEQMLPGRTRKAIDHRCRLLGIQFRDGRMSEEARAKISVARTKFRIDDDGRECTKCREYKAWLEYAAGNGPRGHSSHCRSCTSKYHTEWYQSDLEGNRERGRLAEERHRDKVNPDRKRFVPCYQDENGRECPKCRVHKTWDQLHHWKRGGGQDGGVWACKSCWRESVRKSRYLRIYSITVEQFEELERDQGGVCALCSEPEDKRHPKSGELFYLSIEHDHACGRHEPERACQYCIRGLTCYGCNQLIGYAEKRGKLREMVAEYLTRRPLLEGMRS